VKPENKATTTASGAIPDLAALIFSAYRSGIRVEVRAPA
jgi:hypothetical protein